MSNILLRSPFYEYKTRATAASAKLILQIDGITRYTIIKDTPTEAVTFEIAQLARDYLDVTFSGTYQGQKITVEGEITYYDATNATGSTIGDPDTFTYNGLEGYWDYYNTSTSKLFCASGSCIMQDNTTIYVPDSTGGFIPVLSSGSIIYEAFTGATTSIAVGSPAITVTIKRIDCSRYTALKVTFVNKYGALQDLYFDKKNMETLTTESEKYKNALLTTSGGYSKTVHQQRILKKEGTERITLNTGYIDDGMNETMKQLMLSEQVWLTKDSEVQPVNIATNSLTMKTSLNEKLVNYTINVEQAHSYIDNVR